MSFRGRIGTLDSLGLGLYITDRIVAAHGGHIGVESSEQDGTTFTIHLPKRARTAAPPELITST